MADVHHKTNKTDRQFFFSSELNWQKENTGISSAHDINTQIKVAAPPQFGGPEGEWSPEHLFLSALSSCLMTTYIAFTKKMDFTISDFSCTAIGQVEIVNGHYEFTHINLYPKIFIADISLKDKAALALEKAQKYCLISNSVKPAIIYHGEISVKPFSGEPAKTIRKKITAVQARQTGDRLGIDWNIFSFEEFRRGLEVELEHGTETPETNITNDDLILTAKIAWAHLHEMPDYYTRLDKMEKEAEAV